MRQIFLASGLEHTATQLTYKGTHFRFSRVTENLQDIHHDLTYQDAKVLIFGENAQGAADYLMKKYQGGNLKIRAAEIESTKLRDLCSDRFEYCKEIEDVRQLQLAADSFAAICGRRTTLNNGEVSRKVSRIYEIRRCCYNEECRQTHGSVRILVVGEADFPALKEFAGQKKGRFTQFLNDRNFDVCCCMSAANIDRCMEVLFLLE